MSTYVKPKNPRYRPERISARGDGHSGGGGTNIKSRQQPRVIDDIFALESPKAHAPLGYIAPLSAKAIDPDDFKNDTPLPSYPYRAPVLLTTPLGATFVDTEMKRPNATLNRKPIPRKDVLDADPVVQIVRVDANIKRPLMLGVKLIAEKSVEVGKDVPLENLLKRSRDNSSENDRGHKMNKRQKKEIRMKLHDGSEDINNDIVHPENVLRMVDSSLVDTPEKDYPRGPRDFVDSRDFGDRRFSDRHGGGDHYGKSSDMIGARNSRYYDDRPGSSSSGSGWFGPSYDAPPLPRPQYISRDYGSRGGPYNDADYGRYGQQPWQSFIRNQPGIPGGYDSPYDPWVQGPRGGYGQRKYGSDTMGTMGMGNLGVSSMGSMEGAMGPVGQGPRPGQIPPMNYDYRHDYTGRQHDDRRF